jgi:phage-related minor tail protein
MTARSGLDAITGIPTPAKVAAAINPYVSSLQRYEMTLAGTAVPAAARTAAAGARTLVSQDVQFLSTLSGLAPLRLGSYLEQFGKNATQLQAVLSRLEGELRTATS